MKTVRSCLWLLVAGTLAGVQAATVSLAFSSPKPALRMAFSAASASVQDSQTGMWRLTLDNPDALATLSTGDTLTFTLADAGKSFALVLTASERAGAAQGWRAAIGGVACATVCRGTKGWRIEISDMSSGLVYQLRQAEGASWVATRHDPNLKPITYGEPLAPTNRAPAVAAAKTFAQRAVADAAAGPAYLDVLFAFDNGGRQYVEDVQESTLEAYALSQIAKMNAVLANSQLDDRFLFRYSGTVAVDASTTDLDTALVNASYAKTGWSDIAAAREKFGADLVSVSIDTGSEYGTVGLGYGLESVAAGDVTKFSESAYHAISVRAGYLFDVEVHEAGHNLGAGHYEGEKDETPGCGQSTPYSFGYYFRGTLDSGAAASGYHTIMAYNKHPQSGVLYNPCHIFSSPDIIKNNVPVGTATNDNRRVLLQTYAAAAEWRPARQSAVGPSFTLSAGEFAEGATQSDMTFHLNGCTVDENGALVIGSSPPYIETGLTASSEAEGLELTVVVTLEGVDTSKASALLSLASASKPDAVGVGQSAGGSLSGIWDGVFPYVDWQDFATCPGDGGRHRIAFGYAAQADGKGSGDYRGSVLALDGKIAGASEVLMQPGERTTRVTLGGRADAAAAMPLAGAKIVKVSVYTGALSEARLRQATDDTVTVGPFMTVNWDQHAPFNDFSPVIGGVKTPCGCAATAAVQMFKHYAWPVRTGSVFEGVAHTYSGSAPSEFRLRVDGHNDFLWAEMKDDAAENAVAGNYEAARATLWCDALAEMDFRVGDSSADISGVAENAALWYEKGRSTSVVLDGEAAVRAAMTNALDKGELVQVMLNGHQVVADGYKVSDNTLYVHLNWGHANDETGWYTPEGLAAEYKGIKNVWTGLVPKKTAQVKPLPKVSGTAPQLQWAAPARYQDDITDYALYGYLRSDDVGTFTGDAGTIAPDRAGCYYQRGVVGVRSDSAIEYAVTSYYTCYVKVELQARFDAGEWVTLDTPVLSTEEDDEKAGKPGEVNYVKTVALGQWAGRDAEFRFLVTRSGRATYAGSRISYAAPTWTNVYVPGSALGGTVGKRTSAALSVAGAAGKVVSYTVTPVLNGVPGEPSEPVATKISSETIPAQPAVASVDGLTSALTDGFRRTCAIGKSVFLVKVNGTATNVTASVSHLALAKGVTVADVGSQTWAVAVDATGVPSGSQMILTVCAEDALGNRAYKDLQLTFAASGVEQEDALAEAIAAGEAVYVAAGATYDLALDETRCVFGRGNVSIKGGLPEANCGLDDDRFWRGRVDATLDNPTAADRARLASEFRNANSTCYLNGEKIGGEEVVAPILVWQGSFDKAKSGWTIDANGNALAEDGSSITLNATADGTGRGVKLAKDGLSLACATVLVRYSDYAPTARRRTLVAFDTASQGDRWGLGLNAANKLNLFRGTDYNYYTGNDCAMAETGTFGVTVVNNGNKCAYVPLAAGGTGVYSRSTENEANAITGFTLGGISGAGATGYIGEYDNLSATITGIAVFDCELTQQEVENYVWPTEPACGDGRVISFDVRQSDVEALAGDQATLAGKVPAAKWTTVGKPNGGMATATATSAYDPKKGEETAVASVTMTAYCFQGSNWAYLGHNDKDTAPADEYGYLRCFASNRDRGCKNSAYVKIENIPFEKYDLYFYFSGAQDGFSTSAGAPAVAFDQTTSYAVVALGATEITASTDYRIVDADGALADASAATQWGDRSVRTPALGANVLKLTDQTERSVTLGYIAYASAVAAVQIVEKVDTPIALSEMYCNRLSTGDATVPAGKYGAITVPESGYRATAFATATALADGPSGDEVAGSYTNVICKVGIDTDLAAHTVMGWFKADALPSAAGAGNAMTLYAAKSYNGDYGGYKVAVGSDGTIYVGQCNNDTWRNDGGKSTVHTTTARVTAGAWFHLAVAVPGRTDDTRTTTAAVFVDGREVETAGGPFGTNLNGSKCEYVRIGAGVGAAGFYIDTTAIEDARLAVLAAGAATVPGKKPEPEITKDPVARTWIVDTTACAYTFTEDEIAELKATAWKVTLRSASDLGATVAFGSQKSAQAAHFVIESGAHAMTWLGDAANISFNTTGTAEDPSILVKDGATLNFTVKDLTGWLGAAQDKTGNLVRVNAGGTLNLAKTASDNTHYYQGRYWLDPGAAVTATFGDNKFRLNGGAVQGGEQLYMPDAAPDSEPATLTVANGLRLAKDATAGLGASVGEHATLVIVGDITSDGEHPLTKWGAGTLEIDGALTGFTGTLTANAGTLSLTAPALGGSLAMAAGTTLAVRHDGEATHGTAVLTASSLAIADGVRLVVNGTEELYAVDGGSVVVEKAVAEVGGRKYGTLAEAVAAAGNGGRITLLVEKTPAVEAEFAALGVTATQVEGDVYAVTFHMATDAVLAFSEIMPKPSDKPYEITTQSGYDKNGLESGWVEVVNTGDKWADLGDYQFWRANRGKKPDQAAYGNFPTNVLVAPHGRYTFYTSERYANSASRPDSAWEHGTFDGKPIFCGDMLIWGDKVNPKKFPYVTLAYKPAGAAKATAVDTVVVPSDTPEGYSIVVGAKDPASYTRRWLCPSPTFNAPNGDTASLRELGPNVGPLYGAKHSADEFGPQPPARFGEDYVVTLCANPVYQGTAADAITNVVLVYRTKLGAGPSGEVPMTAVANDTAGAGATYSASIPHDAFDGLGNGQLIQWKAKLYDAAGNVWTSPSFNNPDDGYAWYGTITEPGALNSAKLPTWHMFLDDDSLREMDLDVDKQTLPNKARAAIYDASTSNYYDYVRIDLRGHTSASFAKKSHGFRFAKAHPLTMTDIVSGKAIKEIRKTSLIGEPADPSYLRQLTAFWLLNKVGSPAPFDFPVRVNRNGEFYQLAFNSERFTDELIEDVYGLDKYGYGYKNVGTLKSGGSTTAGDIEKKTPDDGHDGDISVLQDELRAKLKAAQQVGGATAAELDGTDATGLDNPELTRFVVRKFDLPAWLNYLAATRITQEMDDVWANLSIYYDNAEMKEGARGTDTWMPLAYDMNISFGQYYHDVFGARGLIADYDWFKGHPFYGGNRVRCYKTEAFSGTVNAGNDGFEAVWQNAKFRRLYLRRLRTLMDQELKSPGTPETEVPLMVKMRALAELMRADTVADKARWPHGSSGTGVIDAWGGNWPATIDLGVDDLWNNYIRPRQTHLYVTHAVTNTAVAVGYAAKLNAGIPEAQSPIAALKGGFSAAFDATAGATVVSNANAEAVDLSGWTLEGPMAMTLPSGTVVDANDVLYVVADRRAYVTANAAALTDQVVVGNATAGDDPAAPIILKAADGTSVIAPSEKSEQEKYLRLWGFCGVPVTGDDAEGEFIVFTNLNQTASLDATGADIQFEKTTEDRGRCHFPLPANTVIKAGGWVRFNRNDIPWDKITNGDIDIFLKASNGASIYAAVCLSQESLGVKATGDFAVYDFAAETWGTMPVKDAPGHEEPEPPTPPEPGEGEITGEYPDGTNIVLAADTVLKLGNATFGKALTLTGKHAATLVLTAGATATIPKIEAAGAALVIDGTGALVMSNDEQLVTCAGLTVTNGAVTFTYAGGGAASKAVELTGDYIQYGGAVTMNLVSKNEVYGFWTETKKKVVKILGGTFDTTIDGGAKSATFKLEKGSNDVTLGGGAIAVTLAGEAPRFVQTKAKLDLCGSTVTVRGAAPDARVFKSAETLTVSGGVVTGTASGAGSEIFSADDTIRVQGGTVSVTAADDCFSAQTNIVIGAGKVQALSTAGDAIDSNGSVTISGGYVFANTLFKDGYGIEADETFVVSGGSVVAVGGKNVLHAPDAGSVACYTNASITELKKYLVLTSDGSSCLERLSVNLKSGEKRNKNGFSLVAVVPNMLGTYEETDTKPSEDTPKGEKLDKNLDGVFVTVIAKTPVAPGSEPEMKAKTEAEARREIVQYKVELTQEDKDAGVPEGALKMAAVPVTDEQGAVVGYKAQVAVNPDVVPVPSVGGEPSAEVEPIVVTPSSEGAEVSVGIVNATKGLWYGYEVSGTPEAAFANDCASFKRAEGAAMTVKGSPQPGASAFFRVKVLPAKPTK